MRTLVFCTTYAVLPEVWTVRYRRWLEALQLSGVEFDQCLLVDDGSLSIPGWTDAHFIDDLHPVDYRQVCDHPVLFYRFRQNLGRRAIYDFPGWFRSFKFGVLYGRSAGFDKIIHLESDAFLISERMISAVNRIESGWTTFFSETHEWPEMAIQVLAGEQIEHAACFLEQPYSQMIGKPHEFQLPFTKVDRKFLGGRYGETWDHIPADVDFSAQTQCQREASYYWWIDGDISKRLLGLNPHQSNTIGHSSGRPVKDGILSMNLSARGNVDEWIGDGWSYPEDQFRWMIGTESHLKLPPVADVDTDWLSIALTITNVFIVPRVPSQKLIIQLNRVTVGYYDLYQATRIGFDIPAKSWLTGLANSITFYHFDGVSPRSVTGSAHEDPRSLSAAVSNLTLYASRTPDSTPQKSGY